MTGLLHHVTTQVTTPVTADSVCVTGRKAWEWKKKGTLTDFI